MAYDDGGIQVLCFLWHHQHIPDVIQAQSSDKLLLAEQGQGKFLLLEL